MKAATLEVGRRVYYRCGVGFSGSGEGVVVAMHGTPTGDRGQPGIMQFITPGQMTFDVITFDGVLHSGCREHSIDRQCIGGLVLLDRVHGPAMIERAHCLVAERTAREATAAADAKQKRADTVERIKAENPNLIQADQRRGGLVQSAKNIRSELKSAGVKASVRSQRFAGGDSISVYLPHDASDDAMTTAKTIAGKYQEGNFNGMEDIYEYGNSPWTEVFGGAKYITVQRDWAPEAVA